MRGKKGGYVVEVYLNNKNIGWVCKLRPGSQYCVCDTKKEADIFDTDDLAQGAIDDCTYIFPNATYCYNKA